MVRGLMILLGCQLVGEFLVTAAHAPLPGPVVGMVILLVIFRVRHPTARSPVVRTADGLLNHLQLLFIPAGAGVIVYLPLLASSWLPILGGLVLGWLAALAATAGAGVLTLRWSARWSHRSPVRQDGAR